MTAGYRIWPAALLAIGAATGVAVLTGFHAAPGPSACSAGGQWVTMAPLVGQSDTFAGSLGSGGVASWRAAKLESTLAPVLAGCLDVDRVTPVSPAELPDFRS